MEPISDLYLPRDSPAPRIIAKAQWVSIKLAECSVDTGEKPTLVAASALFWSPWSCGPVGGRTSSLENHIEEQRQAVHSHSWTGQCYTAAPLWGPHSAVPTGNNSARELQAFETPWATLCARHFASQTVQCNPPKAGKETHAEEKEDRDGRDLIDPQWPTLSLQKHLRDRAPWKRRQKPVSFSWSPL